MNASRLVGLLLLVGLFAIGCGKSGSGTYHLSGKVTFDGKPVPAGRIFFLPDSEKGNSGQGGFAEIKDGVFDTRNKGRQTPGGALIVRIDGFDGKGTAADPVGQPLFLTFELKVDLPKAQATKDFEVPASAANTLPKGGGERP
jgi:hypothetical protein